MVQSRIAGGDSYKTVPVSLSTRERERSTEKKNGVYTKKKATRRSCCVLRYSAGRSSSFSKSGFHYMVATQRSCCALWYSAGWSSSFPKSGFHYMVASILAYDSLPLLPLQQLLRSIAIHHGSSKVLFLRKKKEEDGSIGKTISFKPRFKTAKEIGWRARGGSSKQKRRSEGRGGYKEERKSGSTSFEMGKTKETMIGCRLDVFSSDAVCA